jgi:hypothetical protein
MSIGNSLVSKMAFFAFIAALCHSRMSETRDRPLFKNNVRWVRNVNGRAERVLKSSPKPASGHLQSGFNITYNGPVTNGAQPPDPYDTDGSFYVGKY